MLYCTNNERKAMKLIYQPLGTSSLVGIETNDETERTEQYWSFWNHGATSGKLHEMSENFHYITTSDEKLERYFLNSSFHLLLNKFPEKYKGIKGGVMEDARKLAKRLNLDPNRWFGNVEKAILLLKKPKYYKKAKYGYCRGTEPVKYVSEIQLRYEHYAKLLAN